MDRSPPLPFVEQSQHGRSWIARLAPLYGVVAMLLAAAPCGAEVVLDQPFNGPTPSWVVAPSANFKLLMQQRTQTQEVTAERLVLACPPGYAAQIKHPVQRLPVLDEVAIEVVQRSNHPGLQLAAEVVFPRNVNTETGQPLRAIIYGQRSTTTDRWQRLRLENVPQLVTRQARLMSVGPNQQVDDREAYIDQVVLVVPGGAGESLLEVDQLTVMGVTAAAKPAATFDGPALTAATGDGPLLAPPNLPDDQQPPEFKPVNVRRHGATIMVEGQPIVPRAMEYHGESFEQIARLGFNTVYLAELPTEAQLLAASKAKLWVVCPPPENDFLSEIAPNSVWQTVLAWSLGLENTALALDQIASQSEAIRRADPLERPILVGAGDRPRRFAQQVDVLVRPEKISLDSVTTAAGEPALPVLGCSPWVEISLGWSPQARQQAEAFAPGARHLGWHEPWRVRQALLEAMTAGNRGLLVRTPERLGGTSPEAKQLEDQLQLVNRELLLAEPWLVAGKRVAGGEMSRSDYSPLAWQLGRSRLIFLPGSSDTSVAQGTASLLVVAGVSETSKAHLLTAAGLIPLRGQRVAGGYQVTVGHQASPRWVVVTDDTLTLAQVERRLGSGASAAAQLGRMLAMSDVMELEAVIGQLYSPQTKGSTDRVAGIKHQLEQCDQLLAAKKYATAMGLAQSLRDQAAQERRQLFLQVTGSPGFASLPTEFELRLLPIHQSLQPALASLKRSSNLLPGGDFEDLSTTQTAGWHHNNYADSQHETAVEFNPVQPQHGRACLRMAAQANSNAVLASGTSGSVVWVTSPMVAIEPGSVIEITGWVRVVSAPQADGRLLVQDTLGGEELALRIPTTTGWQPFRLLRTMNQTGDLQLHLALTGAATADVDAVMVRKILVPQKTAQSRVGGGF